MALLLSSSEVGSVFAYQCDFETYSHNFCFLEHPTQMDETILLIIVLLALEEYSFFSELCEISF